MNESAPNTILDCLDRWATDMADRRAFTFLNATGAEKAWVTFGELQTRARDVAGHLVDLGFRGKHLALMYRPGIDFVVAFLGCLYAEAVAVPIQPARRSRDDHKMRSILESGGVAAVLTESDTVGRMHSYGCRPEWLGGVRLVATDILDGDRSASLGGGRDPSSRRLAMLQYTSGSTSLPKGVMLTHHNLMSDLRMLHRAASFTQDDVYASWLPHYHDMGLIAGLLGSLYAGIHCVLMAPLTFIHHPIVWLRTITKYGITASGGPNFAYRHCVDRIRAEDCQGLRLDSWKVAVSGAEPLAYDDMRAFHDMFQPYGFSMSAFAPGYGLAEACVYITCVGRAQEPTVLTLDTAELQQGRAVLALPKAKSSVFVGCGVASDEEEVVIVEPGTRAVFSRPFNVGEICVSGDNVMQGYWNRPEETAQALVSLAGRPGKTFLRTGDLGFLDADSNLFITGRTKDLIIVRGVNHYPHDIERVVERVHADIRPGCAVAFAQERDGGEGVVVLAELEHSGVKWAGQGSSYVTDVARAICDAVADDFEITLDAVVFLKPGEVVRTSSGKLSRQGSKQAFLADELQVVGRWAPAELHLQKPSEQGRLHENLEYARSLDPQAFTVLSTLLASLASTSGLGFADVDLSKSIFFYGVNSLNVVDLHSAIESRVGTTFSVLAFFRSNTLRGLIDDICRAIDEGSAWVESGNRFYEDVAAQEMQASSSDKAARSHEIPAVSETAPVLLTGAAGFLGVYLLQELLQQRTGVVYCLVRATDPEHGLRRILENAESYGLELASQSDRIRPLIGDITKPQLGLDDRICATLAEEVGLVFHCAAVDNFYLPYESLRAPNVLGVMNVAEFARRGRVKPLFYSSSCGAAMFDEGLDRFEPDGMLGGYAQSKFVAERFVRALSAQGFPAISYRLGYLYSNGKQAVDNEQAFETLLESMYRMNCVPDLDAAFDLTSVEYAAKCMVDTAALIHASPRREYTLYNPVALEWADVIARFKALRPGLKVVSLEQFRAEFRAFATASTENRLRMLKSVIGSDVEGQLNAMFRNVTPDVLEQNIHLCLPCDAEFVAAYIGLVLRDIEQTEDAWWTASRGPLHAVARSEPVL